MRGTVQKTLRTLAVDTCVRHVFFPYELVGFPAYVVKLSIRTKRKHALHMLNADQRDVMHFKLPHWEECGLAAGSAPIQQE